MKRLIAWVLVAAACVGLASAGSAQTQWNDPAVVETLKQIERDMGQAMVAVDIEKLNRIFADDWTSIGASGAVVTKEKVLQQLQVRSPPARSVRTGTDGRAGEGQCRRGAR